MARVIFEKLGSLAAYLCLAVHVDTHNAFRSRRTYPPRFGLHLVGLFDKLVHCRCDPPEIPTDLAAMPLPVFFESLSWESDLWEDAFLVDVLRYIRGNKALDLGPIWRPLFPAAL